ncbi:MAG TPA: amidase [Anaerolineales bacterium]|nr:amidase [Anaerolineales bacterium]
MEKGILTQHSPAGLTGTLASLAQALRTGALPLLAYLEALQARVEAREPQLLALVPEEGRFDRLRRQAQALLDRYPEPGARPPLFGVPLGVKDVFHAQGFETRAGSQLPPERLRGPEAESVARLKGAGALILGKTVTTEFAYFASGPTRNPHHPEHTPGGSSSGSAAAVAAGMAPVALGTQTIGSITRPAAFCGVVGTKPSFGRLSTLGVIPLAPSLDHIGFFTAEASAAGLIASLLIPDWRPEPAGPPWPGTPSASLRRPAAANAPSKDVGASPTRPKPVLGVPEGPYLAHTAAEGLEAFEEACDRLSKAGYRLQRLPAMADFEQIVERHQRILAAEAARVHAAWFVEFGDRYHPKTADLIRRGQGISAEALAQDLRGRAALRQELLALMEENGLDLWISPAAPGAAPHGLDSTGDPIMNLPWTHSGLPTIGLPCGFNRAGLPFGLQLTGRWRADEALLAWAVDLERALQEAPAMERT